MSGPVLIAPSIDDDAEELEYRLVDAVTAVQTWLAAMRAGRDESKRRDAADHAVQSLGQIERLAAHAQSLLKRADFQRSEE